MNNLYNVISTLCESHGIKPGKMCSDIGISRGNISDLKMGRIETLSTASLAKIAEYFNVSVDYLLGSEQREKPLVNGDEELTEYLEELRTRPEMRMLFQLTSKATKADVEKAVKIVEALLEKEGFR